MDCMKRLFRRSDAMPKSSFTVNRSSLSPPATPLRSDPPVFGQIDEIDPLLPSPVDEAGSGDGGSTTGSCCFGCFPCLLCLKGSSSSSKGKGRGDGHGHGHGRVRNATTTSGNRSYDSSVFFDSEESGRCRSTEKERGADEEDRHILKKQARVEFKRRMDRDLKSLKDRLRYHFTSPFHKFRFHRKRPYKFTVQFTKLVVVTLQLVVFAQSSFGDSRYYADNLKAMRHVFVKGYDEKDNSPVKVYTTASVLEQIEYASKQYYKVNTSVLGSYDYVYDNYSSPIPPIVVYVTQFQNGTIFAFNDSYIFDPQEETDQFEILDEPDSQWKAQLEFLNVSSRFDRLNSLKMTFQLKTVYLLAFKSPDCIKFNITITIDNSLHDGVATVSLEYKPYHLDCRGTATTTVATSQYVGYIVLLVVVVSLCLLSMMLIIRSLFKAYYLSKDAAKFFKKYCHRQLKVSEKLDLVNWWFIVSLIADIFTITGSVTRLLINDKYTSSYLVCSIFLGIGTGLSWIGILQYFSYFQKYNILLVTLKAAAPSIIRFMICVAVLYIAFVLCGWAVLGPYNTKFTTIVITSDCLFSLLNGDDMFNTYMITSDANMVAYVFCQVYIYVFVSLFIYVVLNLFIGLISEMYSAVRMMGKKQWKAIYLGKLYQLLEEDDDTSDDDDLIDWHRNLQRSRWNSVGSSEGMGSFSSLSDIM
eukprot:m.3898 g.3898  ORF g.3898 m.3898 type:complete len:697 (+) comp9950_c0_seq2:57-2147(+)